MLELLWPHQLRLMVNDLKRKGQLNTVAYKQLEKSKLIPIFLLPLYFLVIFFDDKPAVTYVGATLLIMAAYTLAIRFDFSNVFLPYTSGFIATAKVVLITRSRRTLNHAPGWRVVCTYNGKTRDTHGLNEFEHSHLVRQGEYIQVLVNPKNPNFFTPYFPRWVEKYNLKNIIKASNQPHHSRQVSPQSPTKEKGWWG